MLRQSVVLLALVLCGVMAVQPGCRTRYEMRMKWTVQNMSGGYWECVSWGHSVRKACPAGTLFSAPFQTCVPTKSWEEFPYHAPPTTVNDYADECTQDMDVCVNTCLDDEVTTQCIGGNVVNGQCICPVNWILKNGVCIFVSSIDTCRANERWDVILQRCVCIDGFQLVNGQCFSQNDALGSCQGAPATAYLPGNMDCNPIACTNQQYLAETLYPTRNPRTFWQCANINWIEEMPCAPGTCFDFNKQVCVHAADWVNHCM